MHNLGDSKLNGLSLICASPDVISLILKSLSFFWNTESIGMFVVMPLAEIHIFK